MPLPEQQGLLALPTQLPQAPVQQADGGLLSTLSALAGLGLNIGGIATQSGAHGTSSLNLANSLREQAQEQQRQQYAAEKANAEVKRTKDAAEKLRPRLGEIYNPNTRAQAKELVDQGDYDKAYQVISRELDDQTRNQQKSDSDYKDVRTRLSSASVEESKAQLELLKQVDPVAYERSFQQKLYSGFKELPKTYADFQAAYNGAPGVPKKIDQKQAKALFQEFKDHYSSKDKSGIANSVGSAIGLSEKISPPSAREAFSDFAQKYADPASLMDLEQKLAGIESSKAKQKAISEIQNKLALKKTRGQALTEAEQLLLGSTPAQAVQQVEQQAPAADPKLKAFADAHTGGDLAKAQAIIDARRQKKK